MSLAFFFFLKKLFETRLHKLSREVLNYFFSFYHDSFQVCITSLVTCTGIWPEGADGTDINAVARSHDGKLLVSADDFGKVHLFSYPCCQPRVSLSGGPKAVGLEPVSTPLWGYHPFGRGSQIAQDCFKVPI